MPNLEKQKEIFFKVHRGIGFPDEFTNKAWDSHPAFVVEGDRDEEFVKKLEEMDEARFENVTQGAAMQMVLEKILGVPPKLEGE